MRNTPTPSFKRLILRAVLNDVNPIVARVVSIPDDVEITKLHDVFLSILGWQHDLGFFIRVHGQEFNSYQRRFRGKRLRDFQLRRQEKSLYICHTRWWPVVIEHASEVCHTCPQGHEGRPKQGKVGGLGMDGLSRFCCQNAACAAYGKRGGKNLTVCMRYGAGKHLRLLYCRLCHTRFSERKGTSLFQARLPAAKVESVLAHIAEGCGVRKTGRLVGVNRETVARYAVLAGTPRPCLTN